MKGTNKNVKKGTPAEVKEWLEWSPEVIEAIRSGYLDDILAQIEYECRTRKSLVDRYGYYSEPPKKIIRKKRK